MGRRRLSLLACSASDNILCNRCGHQPLSEIHVQWDDIQPMKAPSLNPVSERLKRFWLVSERLVWLHFCRWLQFVGGLKAYTYKQRSLPVLPRSHVRVFALAGSSLFPKAPVPFTGRGDCGHSPVSSLCALSFGCDRSHRRHNHLERCGR